MKTYQVWREGHGGPYWVDIKADWVKVVGPNLIFCADVIGNGGYAVESPTVAAFGPGQWCYFKEKV